jgi:filamentous hemagglutinin family protein
LVRPLAAADLSGLLSSSGLAQMGQHPSANQPGQVLNVSNTALQAQMALSSANLARATQAINDITAAEAAARASSQLTLNNSAGSASSWNGTALSGLNPLDQDPTLWINADPLQKNAATATATVRQTSANAVLTWQSFDLNKGETLVFDQQNNADWTVLNRIVAGPRGADGSRFVTSPSVILGAIQAPGNVYVINPNGIIFGPTAQINVHSLIASSLDVGNPNMTLDQRNSFFLNTGILGNGSQVPSESFSYDPQDKVVEGDIVVDAGAEINASLAPRSISPDAGGSVYLFAPDVENHGSISTPAGETMMVAAQAVQLIANSYPDVLKDQDGNPYASPTIRAVGVNTTVTGQLVNGPNITDTPIIWREDGPASDQIAKPGTITNTGLIDAERGVVIMNGDIVTNTSSPQTGPGVIRANTSVTRNGEIFLDARLQLSLGNGVIEMLPDENGETIPVSALGNFTPGSIEMRGEDVTMASGALVIAPGANVTVSTPSVPFGIYPDQVRLALPPNPVPRIYMDSGSDIDVSGLEGVSLPMSDNFLTFQPFGNEFADQPLQRNGALRGVALTVDLRQTGSLNGASWVGTPLADLTGYANSVQEGIDQLLTGGGNVTLSSPLGVNGQVVLRQGSAINVGGGYVQYAGASIATSRLITSDGRIVDIANASPLDTYVGVAGVTQLTHLHWGPTTTETFVDSLISGDVFQPGYIQGSNAGAISLNAAAYVLDGSFDAGVVAGDRQRAAGSPSAMPKAGSLSFSATSNLLIANTVVPLPANFSPTDALTKAQLGTVQVSATTLSDANFGTINLNFSGSVTVTQDAALEVTPGGSISLTGGSVDIEGGLVAHAGAINVESTGHLAGDRLNNGDTAYAPTSLTPPSIFNLAIGANASLDVSGLWVNDKGAVASTLIGGAYINGGSINLKTDARSEACTVAACVNLAGLGVGAPANIDLTGSIVLAQGSLLNVSSGGRVTDKGVLQLDSQGRAAGSGGSVSFQTYAGGFSLQASPAPPTTAPLVATLVLSGSDGTAAGNAAALASAIDAASFSQGGSFTLKVPSIAIGSSTPAPGTFLLPASFFTGNNFGSYTLGAVAGTVMVPDNTIITLNQKNLVPADSLLDLATGANPALNTSFAYLPDFVRAPVNLALSANLPIISPVPFDTLAPVAPSAIALSIGQNAVIQGDPNAAISLSVAGRGNFVPNSQSIFPQPIKGQTAVAEILGTVSAPGGTVSLIAGQNSEIWLGSRSQINVAGVSLTDSRQLQYRAGMVLPGGNVNISATAASASVVGLAGAFINVSGAAGTFDLLSDTSVDTSGQARVATEIWSDAGSITITASTLLYDGGFQGQPGAAGGNGGTLTIISPAVNGTGSETITVRQNNLSVPPNQTPENLTPLSLLGTLTGSTVFLADSLTGSGISNLTLSMGPITGDATGGSQNGFAPGTLIFSGNVSLAGLNDLFLDASDFSLTNVTTPNSAGCNVCLNATYVALRGAGNVNKITPLAGKGILQVSGGTIDIASGGSNGEALFLSGVAQARFISSGDIRLRVPLADAPNDLTQATPAAGELLTAGDLVFQAAQVYPVSGVDFTLKSLAANGTISFLAGPAPTAPPLSAGGQLTVSAANISQGGVLLAPLGTIRLGAQTPGDLSPEDPTSSTLVPTNSVIFGAGSITSVSLDGETVPFGQTANGASWSYDSFTGQPLTAPPAKNLLVSGVSINVAVGATLDLSGGGDIQAMEFVPGTGGTRDVLASANTYAIIPGYNPAAAPIDLNFALQQGDALSAPGSSVYLSGEAGLPAGFYTLLPAHYATLPGAYRVSVVTSSQDAITRQNNVLPDGTLQMAGYFAGQNGTRNARTALFDVQSSSVWRQYTEIDQTSGNSFFGAKTGTDGLPPRLPQDAGHAVFDAGTALNLAGQIMAAPGENGLGGEFDIAALKIQVIRPGDTPLSGYVGIDATQLSNLGVESLLIGGIRSGDDGDQALNVISTNIEVSNDAGTPLEAPEIIMAASVVTPNNVTGIINFDSGSVVEAVGSVAGSGQNTVTIGSDISKIPGNGALVAVSNGAPLIVERQDLPKGVPPRGIINLGGTAAIKGASIVMDTTGTITSGVGAILAGTDVSIAAKSVNVGDLDPKAGFNLTGGLIPQLAAAQTLSLRAVSGTMEFSGMVNFAMSLSGSHLTLDAPNLIAHGTSVNAALSAGEIDLVNSGAAPATPVTGAGALNFTAADIELGSGDKSLSGFSAVTFTGSSLVATDGTGSIDAGAANLTFQTPLLLVRSGAVQSLTTTGTINVMNRGGTTAQSTGEIGGTLSMTAAGINLGQNSLIEATAGEISLTATASPGTPDPSSLYVSPIAGDISLGPGATILANGYVQTFFDTTRVAGGGTVQLISNQGSIYLYADTGGPIPSSRIDVSSPAGVPGYAGSLTLSAANGALGYLAIGGDGKPAASFTAFDSAVSSGSVAGDSGGRLTIEAQTLGTQLLSLPSLFNDTVDVTIHQGDIDVSSGMTAATVNLTIDAGTLTVSSTINASGAGGGSISLFGENGVVLTSAGNLLATASDAGKLGGTILIGTRDAGFINLAGGMIDVSNTADGAKGGTVTLRAPLIGGSLNDVAIGQVNAAIAGATSVTIEGYQVFTPENSAFNGVIDPVAQPGFYGQCDNMGVCTGTLISFVQNFALSAQAKAKFASISPGVLHLVPGIELDNNDPTINGGDITVANPWNLGAGFAGKLVNAQDYVQNGVLIARAGTMVMTDNYGNLLFPAYKGSLAFVPGVSQITSLDYRVGGSVLGEAGALTLRAARDVNVNNSITDGFFNTANTTDATYQKAFLGWVDTLYPPGGATSTDVSNVGGYLIEGATFSTNAAGPPPLAPYAADANGISPVFSAAKDKTPIAGADLFPLIKNSDGSIEGPDGNYSAIASWSYRITAGADVTSPDPLALQPLSLFADGSSSTLAGHGNVTISGHTQYNVFNGNTGFNVTYETPTMVRTGTGSIDIAAGRDFILADTKAPGVVYTAGRNSVALPDPDFTMETVNDPLNPGGQLQIPVATDPTGFLEPVVLDCDISNFCNPYGPVTQAAYPVDGGHLTLTVQQDIQGYEHPTITSLGNGAGFSNAQYFAPWLLAQGTALSSIDFGPFAPLSGYLSSGGLFFTPSQTSWWINFGSFDQGLMSVGGNVRVVAGRDIQELSVSLPTTARVSGGLSSTITDANGNVVANIPVMHLNPSGDLTVIAGGDLESGSFYEGTGDARIIVGGSVYASWSLKTDPANAASAVPVSTVLALDTGTISLIARDSIDIAGVVSAPSLQNVTDSNQLLNVVSQSLSSYGPSSAVSLTSISGDITGNSLSFGVGLVYNIVQLTSPPDLSAYPGINFYPANFAATALHGDIDIADSLQLAPSNNGVLDLLAYDSVQMANTPGSGGGLKPISSGPSLVEAAFDPLKPLNGFAPPVGSVSFDLGPVLLHQDDSVPDLIYAATGDVISGTGQAGASVGVVRPLALEITKPADVEAARDIIDLSFFGQNLAPTDVTSIIAGRDILYTGIWQQVLGIQSTTIPDLGAAENQAGLSLAGPGFFDVEAGRNLGPFVTAAADITASQSNNTTSDPIGTGIVTFGNTVVVGNRRMFSDGDPTVPDAFALGQNNELARRGADIVALFGVGPGVDYQAVITKYINPSPPNPALASPRNYLPELVTYLETLGYPAMSTSDAWTAFNTLPARLQDIFVDQVFMSELQLPSNPNGCCYKQYDVGYSIINTLFPANLGYTDNFASDPDSVATGSLDLLHATIKTMQSETLNITNADGSAANVAAGGDIFLLGPGGGINVGTTAPELNSRIASPSSLGILTLDNGQINTFTDASVLVDQSRILTVQGGDILMWSSNGDLDAGRGAKTTVDFRPLSVNFSPDDLQTINLNGLVTGAGIGTIRSTPDAPAASAALIAPRGIVNAGDAGLRSTGNLDILALLVLNAANIAVVGNVSGVPQVSSVNLGALESANASGGQAAQVAQESVAAAAGRAGGAAPQALPSLITVEVLGFGDCDPEGGRACSR